MVFDVYLEIGRNGRCMAHVLTLPGCFVLAYSQKQAEAQLPAAIQTYYDWLATHEKTAAPPDKITLNIAETHEPAGPFAPGQVAALFQPEQRPLTDADLHRALQLLAYQRTDLLSLIQELAPTMHHWQASPDDMTIDQILRHLARSEQWYLSRLIAADKLPAAWENPAEADPLTMLIETRETAVAHLQTLSASQRTQLHTPTYMANLPDEKWNAPKVLRRMLEHEREHTAHIQQLLAHWRLQFKARLAAERAHLLSQYRGLSSNLLTTQPVIDGYTAKELLPHIASWDAFHTQRMAQVLNGRIDHIATLEGGTAGRNADLLPQFKQLPLEQALAICLKERGGFTATFDRIPDSLLHRQITLPWGWHTHIAVWAKWRYEHDLEHANELIDWRKSLPREQLVNPGPTAILRAILKATRKAFTTLVPLIDPADRYTRPVCGTWTLKDLVGHLTDWEKVGVAGLEQIAAGQLPEFEIAITDFDSFNNANAAARQHQPWETVWYDFVATRDRLLALLDQVNDVQLERPFISPWGTRVHGYAFTLTWAGHETEHATDVRRALQLPDLPEHLL